MHIVNFIFRFITDIFSWLDWQSRIPHFCPFCSHSLQQCFSASVLSFMVNLCFDSSFFFCFNILCQSHFKFCTLLSLAFTVSNISVSHLKHLVRSCFVISSPQRWSFVCVCAGVCVLRWSLLVVPQTLGVHPHGRLFTQQPTLSQTLLPRCL